MEFLKKISSAILLSILVSLPVSMLEALVIYSIINLYEIPYLVDFKYYQIMGIIFIFMITRNVSKTEEDKKGDLIKQLLLITSNRLLRIAFVWSVSLFIHYVFFNY